MAVGPATKIEPIGVAARTRVAPVCDPGKNGTDAANMLFHVVNARHRRKRSMIFTTNSGRAFLSRHRQRSGG
jgi:hypothetical protein